MKTLPLHDDYVAAGADFDDEGSCLVPGHFGDPDGEYQAAIARAVVIDLSCRSKVELAGPDARAFLNNLCTNEVKDLPVGAGCEAFLITAKGKVVAHLNVGHCQREVAATLWLDAVADQAADIIEYLGHFSENGLGTLEIEKGLIQLREGKLLHQPGAFWTFTHRSFPPIAALNATLCSPGRYPGVSSSVLY